MYVDNAKRIVFVVSRKDDLRTSFVLFIFLTTFWRLFNKPMDVVVNNKTKKKK